MAEPTSDDASNTAERPGTARYIYFRLPRDLAMRIAQDSRAAGYADPAAYLNDMLPEVSEPRSERTHELLEQAGSMELSLEPVEVEMEALRGSRANLSVWEIGHGRPIVITLAMAPRLVVLPIETFAPIRKWIKHVRRYLEQS